jgi:hypothetical protein
MISPVDAIPGSKAVRNIIFTLGEHNESSIALDNHHVFSPLRIIYGVTRIPYPVDTVGRSRIAKFHSCLFFIPESGIPQMIDTVVPQDKAAFADFLIPRVTTRTCKHGILDGKFKGDHLLRGYDGVCHHFI